MIVEKTNPKTIRKTYHELQNDGYLIIKPRVGVVVKAPVINSDRLDTHVKRIKFVRQNILEASALGLSPQQLVTLIAEREQSELFLPVRQSEEFVLLAV